MLDILSKNNPKNIAIIKNNFSKTYSELEKDIKFLKCKFNKGEVILLLCDSSYESIIIYLACLQASSIPLLLSDNISQEMILEYERRYLPSQIFSPKIIDLGITFISRICSAAINLCSLLQINIGGNKSFIPSSRF